MAARIHRSHRQVALVMLLALLALPIFAADADAASQRPGDRPSGACVAHPERAGCVAAAEPTGEEPGVETVEEVEPPPSEPDPQPAPPEQEPVAVDDPPTIIQGTSEPPPADECRNLDGEQASVPEGMYLDAFGDCLEPTNHAGGDGAEETEEDDGGGVGPAGTSGGSGTPPPGGGGAGASTATGEGGASNPTAVAGVADIPSATQAATSTSGESLAASQAAGGGLPFTGFGLGRLLALGLLLGLAGMAIRGRRAVAAR